MTTTPTTMFHKISVAFLLTCNASSLLACWGGAEEEDQKIKNIMLDPNNVKNWGGWNPPPGADNAWNTWLQKYKDVNHGKGGAHDPNLHGKYPHGHNEKGWPHEWSGMGPPISGMDPPPWAYVPKSTGKPSYCFLPPLVGNCTQSIERYGYNPYLDICMAFMYTGCGSNGNNFVNVTMCEKACMTVPETGCENESNLPIDAFIWSRRCGYSDDEPSDYVGVRDY